MLDPSSGSITTFNASLRVRTMSSRIACPFDGAANSFTPLPLRRRRPLPPPDARPRRGQAVDPRRLGLEPLGPEQRRDMLEIVEDRYGRGVTLITSQIPVDRWHDLIGDPIFGDAILDRIIHDAHRLQLSGDSLRKQKVPKTIAA